MNLYSPAWFETFLSASDPPSVAPERAFFQKHFPLPDHRRVLDVACGIGRHARALAAAGYDVLGADISEDALAAARVGAPAGATFVQGDMSDLDSLPSDFDVCMCLWQSFGGFSDEENRIAYADSGLTDDFEWQVFTPDEIALFGTSGGTDASANLRMV